MAAMVMDISTNSKKPSIIDNSSHPSKQTNIFTPPSVPVRPNLEWIETSHITSILSARRESDQLLYSSSANSSHPSTTYELRKPSVVLIPNLDILTNMSKFTTLSQADEDDLHAKRLLNIEEKPFKRIQKRLLAPTNPIETYLRRATGATDENTASDQDVEDDTSSDGEISNGKGASAAKSKSSSQPQEETSQYLASLTTFTHQTLHDFSALNTSLARLQFLLTANESERARYTSQTTTITSQHASITSETATLRSRLDEARSRLEQRKMYDEQAKKVLYVNGRDGARAKSREELGRESERLKSEIEELEREGEELRGAWRERREVLARVVDEAGRLRRVVRGEPEHDHAEQSEDRGSQAGDDVRSEDGEGEEGAEKRREEDEGNQHQNQHGSDDHHDHDHDHDDEMLGVGDREAGRSNSNAGTPRPIDDVPTPNPMPMAAESGGFTPLPAGAMTPISMADNEDGFGGATPRPTTSGSQLKQEVHYDGSASGDGSELGGDSAMVDQQLDGARTDVPEVKVESEDKAAIEAMDVS